MNTNIQIINGSKEIFKTEEQEKLDNYLNKIFYQIQYRLHNGENIKILDTLKEEIITLLQIRFNEYEIKLVNIELIKSSSSKNNSKFNLINVQIKFVINDFDYGWTKPYKRTIGYRGTIIVPLDIKESKVSKNKLSTLMIEEIKDELEKEIKNELYNTVQEYKGKFDRINKSLIEYKTKQIINNLNERINSNKFNIKLISVLFDNTIDVSYSPIAIQLTLNEENNKDYKTKTESFTIGTSLDKIYFERRVEQI